MIIDNYCGGVFVQIDGFLFSNHAKGGCTVARRNFSCSHLKSRQEVSSRQLLCGKIFQNKQTKNGLE